MCKHGRNTYLYHALCNPEAHRNAISIYIYTFGLWNIAEVRMLHWSPCRDQCLNRGTMWTGPWSAMFDVRTSSPVFLTGTVSCRTVRSCRWEIRFWTWLQRLVPRCRAACCRRVRSRTRSFRRAPGSSSTLIAMVVVSGSVPSVRGPWVRRGRHSRSPACRSTDSTAATLACSLPTSLVDQSTLQL